MDDYKQKVYNALKGELGSSFNKTEEEFYDKLLNEKGYADKVYGALKGELKDSFDKTPEEFNSLIASSLSNQKPSSKPSQQSSKSSPKTTPKSLDPTAAFAEYQKEEDKRLNSFVVAPDYESNQILANTEAIRKKKERDILAKKTKETISKLSYTDEDFSVSSPLNKVKLNYEDIKKVEEDITDKLSPTEALELQKQGKLHEAIKGKGVIQNQIENVRLAGSDATKVFGKINEWLGDAIVANQVLGLTPSSPYSVALAKKAAEVNKLKQRALPESQYVKYKTSDLSTTVDVLSKKRKEVEDQITKLIGEDGIKALDGWNTYVEQVNAKKAERNPDYERAVEEARTTLEKSGLNNIYQDLNATLKDASDELEQMPYTFKLDAAAVKAEKELISLRDNLGRNETPFGKFMLDASVVVGGGIERNIRAIPQTIGALGALTGQDAFESYLLAESATNEGGFFGIKSSKQSSPISEKTAILHDDTDTYEIGFDDDGNIQAVYDIDGYVVNLSTEEFRDIQEKVDAQGLFKQSKRKWRAGSMLTTGADVGIDVAATILFAGAANALGKGLSAGAIQAMGMYPQYFGRTAVGAIREGSLTPQDAALYSAVSTTLEVLTEGINPLMGKISKKQGWMSRVFDGLKKRNVMAAMQKIPGSMGRDRFLQSQILEIASEIGEEEIMLDVTPGLNRLANMYLGGSFENIYAPSWSDRLETYATTAIATFIPATMSAANDYTYLYSDLFYKESLYRAADPKHKLDLDNHLKLLLEEKDIDQVEHDRFVSLLGKIANIKPTIDGIGGKSAEAEKLRLDYVGYTAAIEAEKNNLSSDQRANKKIDAKVKAYNTILDGIYAKLEALDIPSERAAEDSSDSVATNTDKQGGLGEKASNFSQTQKGGNLTEEEILNSTLLSARQNVDILNNTKVTTEDGKEGVVVVTEGGAVELHTNKGNTIQELGNIDELSDKNLEDFGLTLSKSSIKPNTNQTIDYAQDSPDLISTKLILSKYGLTDAEIDEQVYGVMGGAGGSTTIEVGDEALQVPQNLEPEMVSGYTLFDAYDSGELNGLTVTTEDGKEGTLNISKGGMVKLSVPNEKPVFLGKIDDIYDSPLSKFGLNPVSLKTLGGYTFNIQGQSYVANKEAPQKAIVTDAKGNVVSVSLQKVSYEEKDGETVVKYTPVKVQGLLAEKLALQIHLENLHKQQADEEFDQWFSEQSEFTESNKTEVPPTTDQGTDKVTDEVPSTEVTDTGDTTTDGGADVTTDTVTQEETVDVVDENLQEKGVATKNNPLGIKTEGLTREQILATIKSILKKDKILLYQDEDGNPCTPKVVAKKGLRDTQFNRGGKWSVVEDLKGSEFKTHEQGGVDLQITSKGVAFKGDGGYVKASRGLVIPKK